MKTLCAELLIFSLIVTSYGKYLKFSSKLRSRLLDATKNVLENCESDVDKIGLAGNIPSRSIFPANLSGFSVVLIDAGEEFETRTPRSRLQKLQLFVIFAASTSELEKTIAAVRKSRFWNHMARSILIPTEETCAQSFEYLRIAWKANILEANFLCEEEENILAYTFNPYNSEAPSPWSLLSVYRSRKEHPWYFLVRELPGSSCENWKFEKTSNLGGFQIRASVLPVEEGINVRENFRGLESLSGVVGSVLRTLFQKLNASVVIRIHDRRNGVGYVDEDGNPRGILREPVEGVVDVELVGRYLLSTQNLTFFYPHFMGGLYVATRYTSRQSQISKIVSIFDFPSWMGILFILVLAFVFFRFFSSPRQNSAVAALSLLRIALNYPLVRMPTRGSSRVYLLALLLSILVLQGAYQGNLASVLTVTKLARNIETMDDLAASDSDIFTFDIDPRYGKVLPRQLDDIKIIDHLGCAKNVLESERNACVGFWRDLAPDAVKFKLHVSAEPVVTYYDVWIIRDDWPLQKILDESIQRCVDGHLFAASRQMDRVVNRMTRALKLLDAEKRGEGQSFKVLSLSELGFTFYILLVGWSLAGLAFLVEICAKTLNSK